jgi:hypothetical protein
MKTTDRLTPLLLPSPSPLSPSQPDHVAFVPAAFLPLPTAAFSTIMAKRKATAEAMAEELRARAESNGYKRAWWFPILHFDKAGLRKRKGFCLDGRHQYGSGGYKTARQCRYRSTQRKFLPVVLIAIDEAKPLLAKCHIPGVYLSL